MIFVGGIFLGASVILTTMITLIQQKIDELHLAEWFPVSGILWRIVFGAMAVILTFLAFTFVYKLLPNTLVAWSEAFTAGIVASSLWQVASVLFTLLVQRLDYAAIYGPVGAVVALLSWVYFSSFILLFGAHLSAEMHGIVRETGDGRMSDTALGSSRFGEQAGTSASHRLAMDGGKPPHGNESL
jgi:YihY family inner membrane protein